MVIRIIFCPCFQDNITWLHCLLLQNLLVPFRPWDSESQSFCLPLFPQFCNQKKICQEPYNKSEAESQIKFISSNFWVSHCNQTDSHISNYLYAASCLVETVWEHFQTKNNFLPVSGQRLRFKICNKEAFSSIRRRRTFYTIYAYAIKLLHREKNWDIPIK